MILGHDHNISQFGAEEITCYRGGRTVFQGLSFDVNAGQALILRGPNGSGKSSLLRLLAGFLDARHGTFCLNGESLGPHTRDINLAMHYVGHAKALKPVLTVRENLENQAAIAGTPVQGREDHLLLTATDALDLTHLLDLQVRYLSEGQRRRLSLARLLLIPRAIWLLDEPNSGLDSDNCARLTHMMQQHLSANGIIIAATHLDLGLNATTLQVDDYWPDDSHQPDHAHGFLWHDDDHDDARDDKEGAA